MSLALSRYSRPTAIKLMRQDLQEDEAQYLVYYFR
jgi:hypothetical protein